LKKDLASLQEEMQQCQKCELFKTRKNIVFGEGISEAQVLFVGEAPGQTEDELGLPFVGRSGQLLNKMLAAVGIYRTQNMFITNIVKCRPPNNADPTQEQQNACLKYLERQIEIISPKVIVCVGRIAASSLIDPRFKMTKDHGKITKKCGKYLMGVFHPAALLRSPQNKEVAFKDFLTLKNFIEEGLL
jgi:DNA polymerase